MADKIGFDVSCTEEDYGLPREDGGRWSGFTGKVNKEVNNKPIDNQCLIRSKEE